jgi:hypothetical protein
MRRLAQGVTPLVDLMWDRARHSLVIAMDETPVKELGGLGTTLKGYLWCGVGDVNHPYDCFFYSSDRRRIRPESYLAGFRGYLLADAYVAYERIGQLWPDVTKASCWAHARRKFDEALKAQKQKNRGGLAAQGLSLVQKLYRIERAAREADMSADARKKLRDEKARPVWDELRQWLDAKRRHAPPSTKTGEALAYLDNQWACLIRYLEDGRIEVDNNLCENAIRPFVMGRKAWLFSDTPSGAEASARLYSLIETAKASGCEPYAYLARVFAELPKATTLADVEALLPWNVAEPATRLGEAERR